MTDFWFLAVIVCLVAIFGFVVGYHVCSNYQPLYRLCSKTQLPSQVNHGQTTKYFALAQYWYNDYRHAFPATEFWVEQQAKRGGPWVRINMDYPNR